MTAVRKTPPTSVSVRHSDGTESTVPVLMSTARAALVAINAADANGGFWCRDGVWQRTLAPAARDELRAARIVAAARHHAAENHTALRARLNGKPAPDPDELDLAADRLAVTGAHVYAPAADSHTPVGFQLVRGEFVKVDNCTAAVTPTHLVMSTERITCCRSLATGADRLGPGAISCTAGNNDPCFLYKGHATSGSETILHTVKNPTCIAVSGKVVVVAGGRTVWHNGTTATVPGRDIISCDTNGDRIVVSTREPRGFEIRGNTVAALEGAHHAISTAALVACDGRTVACTVSGGTRIPDVTLETDATACAAAGAHVVVCAGPAAHVYRVGTTLEWLDTYAYQATTTACTMCVCTTNLARITVTTTDGRVHVHTLRGGARPLYRTLIEWLGTSHAGEPGALAAGLAARLRAATRRGTIEEMARRGIAKAAPPTDAALAEYTAHIHSVIDERPDDPPFPLNGVAKFTHDQLGHLDLWATAFDVAVELYAEGYRYPEHTPLLWASPSSSQEASARPAA